MKKIALILGLGSVAVILLVLALFTLGRSIWREDLPVYPDVVTEPGTYWIDSERYIRIEDSDGDVIYSEGTEGSRTFKLWGAAETAIAIEYSDSGVDLAEGWRIGMQKPDTIIIQTGKGDVIRRSFGERTDVQQHFFGNMADIYHLSPEEIARHYSELRNMKQDDSTSQDSDSQGQ